MRDFLFRGKEKSACIWVYGNLIQVGSYCCILEREEDLHPMDVPFLDDDIGWIDGKATPVDPKTVGQFTGLFDKNGKKIFEGDVVKTKFGRLCIVVWFSTRAYSGWDLTVVNHYHNVRYTTAPTDYDMWGSDNLEVVGNIHDNPEYLEVK